MAILASVAATRMAANAAAVATAMAGGTTTAEAAGIADLLATLGRRNDLLIPPLLLGDQTKTQLVPG